MIETEPEHAVRKGNGPSLAIQPVFLAEFCWRCSVPDMAGEETNEVGGEPEFHPIDDDSSTDPPDEAVVVVPGGNRVPRWVIKAIVLFWLGWAVTYLGTGMLRSLRSFLIIVVISLFFSFAIEPAVNRMERWGIRRGLGVWITFLLLFVAV